MGVIPQIDLSKAGSNNFIMIIDKIPDLLYFVQTASMPSLTANQTIIPLPKMASFSVPSPTLEFEELTITSIMDEKFKCYFSIVEWMKRNTTKNNIKETMSDITLLLIDNAKNPVLRVDFVDAFPSTISNFDMGTDDVHSFTFYTTFKYHYYTLTYLDGTELIIRD